MAAVGQRRPPRSAGLALASFYLAKAHIITHNNQSIRPNWRCADDYIITGCGYLDDCRQPRLGKTVARLQIHFLNVCQTLMLLRLGI